jgi:formate dehydrogenase subunit gamma
MRRMKGQRMSKPWAILRVLAAFVFLGVVAITVQANAQGRTSPATAQPSPVIDPDARAVNEQTLLREFPRIQGTILIPAQREAVLIQPDGRIWDYFHEVLLRRIGVVVIFGMLAMLAAGYFLLGRMRISAGRAGIRLLRFTSFERFSHWLTATSFVVLALTGLNITFGKVALRPLIGPDAFSLVAQYAKYVHNYTSFAFVAGLALIVAMWMKDNIPGKIDVTWLKEGGGFIRSKHPTAGRSPLRPARPWPSRDIC